jgi:hypothetical protein
MFLDVIPVFGDAMIEEAGFDIAEADQAPLGHDDLLDEGDFDGAVGLEVILELPAQLVEILDFFGCDDGVFGGESVFEGIAANGGLAFGGFGAGAELGIPAIGGALLAGGHVHCSLEEDARDGMRLSE